MSLIKKCVLILAVCIIPAQIYAYDPKAIQIQNTPSGSIAATNVQGAIDELANEKQPVGSYIIDAPLDDKNYGRKNGSWTEISTSTLTEKAEFTFKSFSQNIALNTILIRAVPYACTITGWEIYSDVSGSIVVDILKSTTASPNAESFTSIAGTELPTLVSAVRNARGKNGTIELTTPVTTIASWTTAVAAGSSIQAKIHSASAGNINGTVRVVVYLERT